MNVKNDALVNAFNHSAVDQAWATLKRLRDQYANIDMRTLFADDPSRADTFSAAAAGLHLDYSKHLINSDIFSALVALANAANLPNAIKLLLSGEPVNHTEGRAALHTLLRGGATGTHEAAKDVTDTLARMGELVTAVHSGQRTGYSGQAFTDVVNIGIGGSDLGPAMAVDALTPYQHPGIRAHFVSNVDPNHLTNTLARLNPATTLFVIASKTFTTIETLTNAEAARDWLRASAPANTDLANHFVAVSTNIPGANAFGISTESVYPMWDWVGGRYSLWSAIGLPIALACGMENFTRMLKGGKAMDEHFGSAELANNLPVIMALLEVWYVNFWDAQPQVILPYEQNLEKFPAFLQQLTMESNGKSAMRDGTPVARGTCPIVWGAPGTNGQHSFHQLLHQGTWLIPADFIVPWRSHTALANQHMILVANCLAQTQVLLTGKTESEAYNDLVESGMAADEAKALAPHKVQPGNRPSSLISFQQTTPEVLGALIALYEHKVFVSSVIWNINAFDQWGVELGKKIGKSIMTALTEADHQPSFDASTEAAIARYRSAGD